jgi:hypothetical protein
MTINAKSTKTEILAAYKDLERAKKELESQIKNMPQITVTEVGNTKNIKNNETAKIAPRDMLKTIQSLSQIQVGFGGAVSSLSEQLIVEATKLENLRKSIDREREDLAGLHELTEIDDTTIDNLIATYQENAKTFSKELEQRQETSNREIEELKQAIDKEREIYLRETQASQELYRKELAREEAEYRYNLNLARGLDREEYDREKLLQSQELVEALQIVEKQWQETEENIAKQEREYAELKEKVETFEEKLKAKIKQSSEEGKGIGIYQAKVKADLRNKEIEGEKQNDRFSIEALERTIQDKAFRIDKLSQQLDAALQQVQNLAVKAIEGNSNRNSYEAMKEIAIEQAKNSPKGK